GTQAAAANRRAVLEEEHRPVLEAVRLLGRDLARQARRGAGTVERSADQATDGGVAPQRHGELEVAGGPGAEAEPRRGQEGSRPHRNLTSASALGTKLASSTYSCVVWKPAPRGPSASIDGTPIDDSVLASEPPPTTPISDAASPDARAQAAYPS